MITLPSLSARQKCDLYAVGISKTWRTVRLKRAESPKAPSPGQAKRHPGLNKHTSQRPERAKANHFINHKIRIYHHTLLGTFLRTPYTHLQKSGAYDAPLDDIYTAKSYLQQTGSRKRHRSHFAKQKYDNMGPLFLSTGYYCALFPPRHAIWQCLSTIETEHAHGHLYHQFVLHYIL